MTFTLPRAATLAPFAAACASLLLAACATTAGTPAPGHFVVRSLDFGGARHDYQVFVPSIDAPGARDGSRPVILFLHGSGERGDDNLKQTQVGLGPYLRAHADTFPAIVVFPQAPGDTAWSGSVAAAALASLDAASREFGGDPRRTYLTGLSMGGYGTWELAMTAPGRFAALVPVCGGITPPRPGTSLAVTPVADAADPFAAAAGRLSGIPVWIFHGAKDDAVPVEQSRRMDAALVSVGADVRYTEVADAGHDVWDTAYSDPGLWTWLFAQSQPR